MASTAVKPLEQEQAVVDLPALLHWRYPSFLSYVFAHNTSSMHLFVAVQ